MLSQTEKLSSRLLVLNKISPKHDLRPILEALIDELSRGSAGVPPTLDSMKVKRIIDQGDPNRYEESGRLTFSSPLTL
jgi:hypothetical protein